ncbi:MAG TPA: hypothetical protein VLT36_15280, partial [Candidatus Dormibacteraeota bacterium]|nr:hypothetical protein [Candidatus Dormibacteraeota bacterium]
MKLLIALATLAAFGAAVSFFVLAQAHRAAGTVTTGESQGFKIGMTKQEVLDQYKQLEKRTNLRTIA